MNIELTGVVLTTALLRFPCKWYWPLYFQTFKKLWCMIRYEGSKNKWAYSIVEQLKKTTCIVGFEPSAFKWWHHPAEASPSTYDTEKKSRNQKTQRGRYIESYTRTRIRTYHLRMTIAPFMLKQQQSFKVGSVRPLQLCTTLTFMHLHLQLLKMESTSLFPSIHSLVS